MQKVFTKEDSFYKCTLETQVNSKKDKGILYSFDMYTSDERSKGWKISKTLKDLHEFRLALARKLPNIPATLPLIKLVGGLTQQQKDKNTGQIIDWLQKIIERTDVMTTENAKDFFDLPEVLQEETPEKKDLMTPLDQPLQMNWPISHFQYIPKKNIFVVAGSDLDEAAQITKGIRNHEYSCCKRTDNALRKPVSEVKIAVIEVNQKNNVFGNLENWSSYVQFEVQFSKPITALHWSDESNQLGVGFQDGKCAVFYIELDMQKEQGGQDETI